MTPADLAAIKARADAATKGPWIAPVKTGDVVSMDAGVHMTVADGVSLEANQAFIAHARTDIPALVAEVERLRDALEPFAVIGRSVPRSWPDKGVIDFTPVYDRASPYFAVRYLGESAPDGVPTVAHWVAADHALRGECQPHP